MMAVYILRLVENKYYVGRSTTPQNRILQHFTGNGNAWTKKYRPVEVVDIRPGSDPLDEDKYTKLYMSRYGVENVRGGAYVRMKLEDVSQRHIEQEIRGASDVCFRCGSKDHFITRCPSKCTRCGRKSHTVEKCYAKTHLDGTTLGKEDGTTLAEKNEDALSGYSLSYCIIS